jgi:hypothetical protein
VRTTSGWMKRAEVVQVEFDPETIAFADLVKRAEARKLAQRVFTRTDAQQKIAEGLVGSRAVRTDDPIRVDDDKFYVSRTPLRHVPMTSLQATRVNARVGSRQPLDGWLSPRQRALLEAVKAKPEAGWPIAIGKPLREAWAEAESIRATIPKDD